MTDSSATLTRTLRLPSLVLFGLAYLAPLIVLGIFGVIAQTTGGATPSGAARVGFPLGRAAFTGRWITSDLGN